MDGLMQALGKINIGVVVAELESEQQVDGREWRMFVNVSLDATLMCFPPLRLVEKWGGRGKASVKAVKPCC